MKHPLREKHATIEDIERFIPLIKHSGNLCNFLDKCEKEVMVAQTIHACKNNHEKGLGCFSFESINQVADNGIAFQELVSDGLLIQGMYNTKPVIFPSKALIAKLDGFFA